MALKASGLGYAYSAGTPFATRAVSDVDLEVDTGDLLLVLGPTGSGKSTLVRMLAGLLEPVEGEVCADGDPLTGAGRAPHGTVGLVFQDPESQLFAETVIQDVAFGPANLGMTAREASEVAERVLREVGLDPGAFASRSPLGLSGGEARRVAIAGVLAMRPAYLLMDEPTAGLDATGREAIHAAVGALRSSAGIVVVTHDPEQFLDVATGILLLAEGRPVFSGDVAELLDDPAPLERAGLSIPEVLRAQLLASQRGARLPVRTADPVFAARLLADAAGLTR